MVRFFARRLLTLVVLLATVAVLSYAILCRSPVDPVRAYVGADAVSLTGDQRARIEARWGLSRHPVETFVLWSGRMLRGDWGHSLLYDRPVLDIILEKSRLSLGLMLCAWCVSGALGFSLGVLAGARYGSRADRLIRWVAYFVASAPAFWVGMVLLMVFSLTLHIAPSCCAAPAGADPAQVPFGTWLLHLALPAATLSFTGIAGILLHTRQKLLDVLQADYALLARAQGATWWGVVWQHGLRNISLPAINVHFASFSELFGGAVLSEQVFAYPGLGQPTVQAGLRGDVPLLLGIVLFSAGFVFLGNSTADALCRALDPRIRIGSSL